ncbi:DUF5304 family protein [Phaeacidiphilus oryzae]|uniref:DUF5304 family protein n=1 Tax=Phaeacidiphilus oryzae TaxID=348818 RepID=UPI000691580F|nr:DUF5304 family protein [Phaeacidiphilus oryzae]
MNASSGWPGRDEPEDVWAEAVAEDAAEQRRRAREAAARAEECARAEAEAGGESGAGPEDAERAGRPGSAEPSSPFGPDLSNLVDEVRRLAGTVGERLQQASDAVTATHEATDGLQRLTAPLREKHPEVYRHLAAAGGELLAAYRAAVTGHERRWTSGTSGSGPGEDDGEGPGNAGEHIDLD